MKLILAHEKAHVVYKHSFDILLSHIYNSFFWFNPFAWLYQKSLVLNLEYEADAKAVSETAKADYQMTLYKITEQNFKSQLQHSFHQSPIKKRIAMLNKNNQTQSLWKLFIVSPLLVVFFLLFQVETKAQIKESVTTSDAKIAKVEVIYDANTTLDEIESDVSFLKEDFDIDMTFSKVRFGAKGELLSISLAVETNDGFSGSVSSSDVASRPVYFFRDFSKDAEVPFGVGTKSKSEMDSAMNYETIKNAENFIINGKKIDKEELVGNYIPVESSSYDDKSKTLSITTKFEFSKPYFEGLSQAMDEMKEIYNGELTEELLFIELNQDYKVTTFMLNKFKITKGAENASQWENANYRSALNDNGSVIYIVDGKEVDQKNLSDIKSNQIESIDVIKMPSEIKAKGFDPKNVDGLIKITTKKENTNNTSESENSYDAFRSVLNNNESVIYIVDGKEVDQKSLNKIAPKQIKSMEVIKSPYDLKEAGYDPKDVDGLIRITTKKNDSGDEIKSQIKIK
jgi:uncharacterized protein (UPF0335 family)